MDSDLDTGDKKSHTMGFKDAQVWVIALLDIVKNSGRGFIRYPVAMSS